MPVLTRMRGGVFVVGGVDPLTNEPTREIWFLALGASKVLGLAGAARQAAILQSGMPSAVLTTILALEFDVAPSFVSACVTLSTLASPITVTLLIAALQR